MPAPRQGTGFINWGQFVNANRAGAGRLRDELLSPVSTDLQRADAGLRGAQDVFSRDVEAGTFSPDVTRSYDALPDAYWGPEALAGGEDYDRGLQGAQRASEGAARLANPYARAALLGERRSNTPTYTAGHQAFDSALLGSVGQGAFENATKGAKGLLERFAAANTAAQGQASAARQQGEQNRVAHQAWGQGWGRSSGYANAQPYAVPHAPEPPVQREEPMYVGTTPIPRGAQPQTQPTTIGTTTINPPQRRNGGGYYLGNQWVPYT